MRWFLLSSQFEISQIVLGPVLVPGDFIEINCLFAVLGVLPFLPILGTQVSLWALAIFMDSSMSPPKIEAQNLRPVRKGQP